MQQEFRFGRSKALREDRHGRHLARAGHYHAIGKDRPGQAIAGQPRIVGRIDAAHFPPDHLPAIEGQRGILDGIGPGQIGRRCSGIGGQWAPLAPRCHNASATAFASCVKSIPTHPGRIGRHTDGNRCQIPILRH
jgi:hypothetical protein